MESRTFKIYHRIYPLQVLAVTHIAEGHVSLKPKTIFAEHKIGELILPQLEHLQDPPYLALRLLSHFDKRLNLHRIFPHYQLPNRPPTQQPIIRMNSCLFRLTNFLVYFTRLQNHEQRGMNGSLIRLLH